MESAVPPSLVLSNLIHYMKYARYLPEKRRRETFKESVLRNKEMHLRKFSNNHTIRDLINECYEFVLDKKILPSMRSLQFGGVAIEKNNCRGYNCSFAPIKDVNIFKEIMFLLLSGCGVGYSVQKQWIDLLPPIQEPGPAKEYIIDDSIEGWADAVGELLNAYFLGTPLPKFIYDKIRKQGSPLITSGGIAPGPEPLRRTLEEIKLLLQSLPTGIKIRPIHAHDILCLMAQAVLAGGIRRSSFISLFDLDDMEMIKCKSGDWQQNNLQRSLANNSPVIHREQLTKKIFVELWQQLRDNNSGEPNIFLTNNLSWGVNPCGEISGPPYFFCNLTEINGSTIQDQEDFEKRAYYASILGTLQSTYTNFPYIREQWKREAERQNLIGVGITGIATGRLDNLDLTTAAKKVLTAQELTANLLGIGLAHRTTTIKPSGTTSLELGNGIPVSSGIGPYHAKNYIRRVTVLKHEPLYKYLQQKHPQLLENSLYRPEREAMITIPLQAPKSAKTQEEGALALLERVKRFNKEWIHPGHRYGDNRNNVSCTITLKEHEWDEAKEWWWENKDSFNSITILPHQDSCYKQLPLEECSEEEYNKRAALITKLNIEEIKENSDRTVRQQEAACMGGICELKI